MSSRFSSPVIASYPWRTSVLAESNLCSAFGPNHFLIHLLSNITQYETLLTSSSTGDGLALCQFLRFEKKYQHLPSNLALERSQSEGVIASLSAKNKHALFNLITLYQLVDAAALLEDHPEPPFKHIQRPASFDAFSGWPKLQAWPSTLQEFRTSVESSVLDSLPTGGTSLELRHINNLAQLFTSRGKLTVLINVQLAVLSLHQFIACKEGQSHLLESSPQLCSSLNLSVQQAVFLQELFAHGEGLDIPLRLALFISPIYLLVPTSLHKKRFDRNKILMAAKSLGNKRHPLLQRVEREIMSSLFKLATQELDLIAEMKALIAKIPWSELGAIDNAATTFFLPASASSRATPLLSTADIEGDVPPGWAVQVAPKQPSQNESYPQSPPDGLQEIRVQQQKSSDSQSSARLQPIPPVSTQRDATAPSKAIEGPHSDSSVAAGFDDTDSVAARDELSMGHDSSQGSIPDEREGVLNRPRIAVPQEPPPIHSPKKIVVRQASALDDDLMDVDGRVAPSGARPNLENYQADGSKDAAMNKHNPGRESEENTHSESEETEPSPRAEAMAAGDKETSRGRPVPRKGQGAATHKPQEIPPVATGPRKPGLRPNSSRPSGGKRKMLASPPPVPKKKAKKQPVTPTFADGSSARTAINVDALFKEDCNVDLNVQDSPLKYSGKLIQGYTPTGERYEFIPSLHSKDDLARLEAFDAAIKSFFVNKRPRHLADPSSSALRIMTEAEFEDMSVAEVQSILRMKHIVLTNTRDRPLNFDGQGLATLNPLSAIIDIQDQSVPINEVDMSYASRHRRGTLRDLHYSAKTDGKILNALDFPMPEKAMDSSSISTHSAAWAGTKGTPACPRGKAPPTGDIFWGLAATAGAIHWWHIDSSGFGTIIEPKCGAKWWIFGRRRGLSNPNFESFRTIDAFLGAGYELEQPNDWDLEAVVLLPRTKLIMRPHTPHSVFTPASAICHGGHFYACGALQDTAFGIIHTFIADKLLTNTEHAPSALLLRRILFFYHDVFVKRRLKDDEYDRGHVPSLTNIQSVLDLFSLCNIIILMNVLDFRTYIFSKESYHFDSGKPLDCRSQMDRYDLNGIPVMERYEIAFARGRSLDILRWFFAEYELYDVETSQAVDGFREVAMAYLARQTLALLEYKKQAIANGVESGDATLQLLKRQVDLCVQNYPDIQAAMKILAGTEIKSVDFPDAEKYGVRRLQESLAHASPGDHMKAGTTAADHILFDAIENHGGFHPKHLDNET